MSGFNTLKSLSDSTEMEEFGESFIECTSPDGDFEMVYEKDAEKLSKEDKMMYLERELNEARAKISQLQDDIQGYCLELSSQPCGPNSNSWPTSSNESSRNSNGHSSEVLELKMQLEQVQINARDELMKHEELEKEKDDKLKKKDDELKKKNRELKMKEVELKRKEEELKEKERMRETKEEEEVTPRRKYTLNHMMHVRLDDTLKNYKILEKVILI